MRILMALPMLAVIACASVEPAGVPVMNGPDGHLWIPLKCGSMLQCRARASFFCPEGYKVADQEGHTEGSFNASSYRGTGYAHGETHYTQEMLIQCASCRLERRYLIDEGGHYRHDPDRSDVVTLCDGTD